MYRHPSIASNLIVVAYRCIELSTILLTTREVSPLHLPSLNALVDTTLPDHCRAPLIPRTQWPTH